MNTRISMMLMTGLLLAGCSWLKPPKPPKPVIDPEAAVTQVRLIRSGDQASRFDITVTLTNPNDFALELEGAHYSFEIGPSRYETETVPHTTLPKSGKISIALPAVLTGEGGAPPTGGQYHASGSITLNPPGQIRRVLYELGLPKPKVRFDGQGMVASAPSTAKTTDEKPKEPQK